MAFGLLLGSFGAAFAIESPTVRVATRTLFLSIVGGSVLIALVRAAFDYALDKKYLTTEPTTLTLFGLAVLSGFLGNWFLTKVNENRDKAAGKLLDLLPTISFKKKDNSVNP